MHEFVAERASVIFAKVFPYSRPRSVSCWYPLLPHPFLPHLPQLLRRIPLRVVIPYPRQRHHLHDPPPPLSPQTRPTNLPLENTDSTNKVVCKDSWPPRYRALQEVLVFNDVNGLHEVPEIVFSMSSTHRLFNLWNLGDLRPCRDWSGYSLPVRKRTAPLPAPKKRVHTVIVHNNIGRSLATLLDQRREYVQATLDATICM